jgi:tetratricopeptide (TPR) repeat protein
VLLDRCELAVLCQVLAATVDGEEIDVRGDSSPDFHHQPSERFAASFTEHFDALAARWPAIAELRSLSLLAALARGLGRIDTPPHLDYWLEEYRVPAVNTPQTVAVLSHTAPWQRFEVFGGVVLEALSLRLKQGDLTAFSGAILQARPSRDALVWSLYLTPELHLVVPPVAGQVDAAQAYARGHHLFLARQYDPAIACWLQVARTYPELGEAYLHIGRAFERKGMPAAAADYYTKALEHDPFVKTQRLWNRSETPVPEKEKVP